MVVELSLSCQPAGATCTGVPGLMAIGPVWCKVSEEQYRINDWKRPAGIRLPPAWQIVNCNYDRHRYNVTMGRQKTFLSVGGNAVGANRLDMIFFAINK